MGWTFNNQPGDYRVEHLAPTLMQTVHAGGGTSLPDTRPEASDPDQHRHLHVRRLKNRVDWLNDPNNPKRAPFVQWCKRVEVGPYPWSGDTVMDVSQPVGKLVRPSVDARLMDRSTYRQIPYLPGYLRAAHHVWCTGGLDNRVALRIDRLRVDPSNADDPNCIQAVKNCVADRGLLYNPGVRRMRRGWWIAGWMRRPMNRAAEFEETPGCGC